MSFKAEIEVVEEDSLSEVLVASGLNESMLQRAIDRYAEDAKVTVLMRWEERESSK